MGIYRVGKPLGVVGTVLKSRVCLVLLGLTSSFYSSSGVCLVVPMRTSVYYLQNMAYYLHSMFGGPPCTSAWSPICTICRVCPILLGVCSIRKSKIFKILF
jgi:hypothetical protein